MELSFVLGLRVLIVSLSLLNTFFVMEYHNEFNFLDIILFLFTQKTKHPF